MVQGLAGAVDGEIIAISEGYASKADCMNAIRVLAESADSDVVVL